MAKKTFIEAVEEVEKYFIEQGFGPNEVIMILRELETSAMMGLVLNNIAIIGSKQDDDRKPTTTQQ